MEGLEPEEEEQEFEFAEDLVRYIDREWKGWFCVGVAGTSRDPSSYNRENLIFAGYPTPHVDSDTPESDIHFLAQKVHAGAHFIITQLFYDVDGFVEWVKRVRAAGSCFWTGQRETRANYRR
jgi:methylenetetrahydrofolate reductase (NADPH)